MEIAGYIASIFIGIALGLIGGGGSILTVPVLVYLFSVDAVIATSYSLFIVGLTSAVGSLSYFKNKLVNIKTAIVFGIPSIIAVFLTRSYIVPAIPKEVFAVGNFMITKSILMMLLFAILMIAASYSMIKKDKKKTEENNGEQKFNYPVILIEGVVVGVLTGLVGAGGGFLIIPTLLFSAKLPMKKAVATSLIIIAVNSLIGFCGSINNLPIDWFFLIKFSMLSILGIFIGKCLNNYISNEKLKPAFGWFVLIMGIYIIIKETILK